MHGCLLMADQNMANGILLEQRIVNRQDCAARIAENNLHALLLKRAEQHLGARGRSFGVVHFGIHGGSPTAA
jgi:hypothetical protein